MQHLLKKTNISSLKFTSISEVQDILFCLQTVWLRTRLHNKGKGTTEMPFKVILLFFAFADGCHDKTNTNKDCDNWATQGYCKSGNKYEPFMKRDCAKACCQRGNVDISWSYSHRHTQTHSHTQMHEVKRI